MKKIALIAALSLSACDAAYVMPKITEVDAAGEDQLSVETVSITPASVLQANRASSYTPKKLPPAFFQSAAGSSGDANQPLPNPVYSEVERPINLPTVLPQGSGKEVYRLGVGDQIAIVFGSSSLGSNPSTISGATEVEFGLEQRQFTRLGEGSRIRDDGSLSVPRIGKVFLEGKTLGEAEDTIMDALLERQLDPEFTMKVTEFKSQKVSIGGLVRRAGVVPVTVDHLTLLEAVQNSGGLELASGAKVEDVMVDLYRDGRLYQVPYTELQKIPTGSQVYLRNGDNIFVSSVYDTGAAEKYYTEQLRIRESRQSDQSFRLNQIRNSYEVRRFQISEARDAFATRSNLGAVERDYVYTIGEVGRQNRFTMPFESQSYLSDVLFNDESAAGIGSSGSPSQVYVLRANLATNNVVAYHLDARNPANIVLATQFEMRPKDIVFVGSQPLTQWNRLLSQLLPTLSAANSVQDLDNGSF